MAITSHKFFHRAVGMITSIGHHKPSGSASASPCGGRHHHGSEPARKSFTGSVASDDSAALGNVSTSSLTGLSPSLSAMSLASHTSLELYRCGSADAILGESATTVTRTMRLQSKNSTALYEGECGPRSQFSGIGLLVAGDFAYAGEWKDSKPHGYGVYVCARTGVKYEGQFQDGVAHGNGRLVHYSNASSADQQDNSVYAYGMFTQGRYEHKRSRCSMTRSHSVKAMSQARKVAAIALAAASQKAQRKFTAMMRTVTTTTTVASNSNNMSASMLQVPTTKATTTAARANSMRIVRGGSPSGSSSSVAATLPMVAPGAVTSLIQCMH